MAETTKFIDAAGLLRFKSNQDAFNLKQFVALDANGVAKADRAVNDADGNSISATYATKSEVSTTYPTKSEVSTTYATKAELSALEQAVESGAVTVGDNISVDENGKITLTETNVTSALGYTPLNESNAMTDAEIDALFA